MILYHGSPFLFEKFDLSNAGEGTGIKFGFGVYLTEAEKSAVHYSQPRNLELMPRHFLYTVEIPDLTDDNHIVSALPVNGCIISRVEAKLGVAVPEKVKAAGKEFRKWVGRTLTGAKKSGFAEEKAAAQLLDSVGVLYNVWPTAQTNPDGPKNIAVFNEANVRIVKVEEIEIRGQQWQMGPCIKKGGIAMEKMRVSQMVQENYPQYYSIESYPADKVARIHKLDMEWGVLSNFYQCVIMADGVKFFNSERLFQVMKFADPEVRHKVYTKAGNPKMTAKHYETMGMRRENWPSTIVDAMKYCLVKKYEWCPEFREALERTKGLYIVEDQTTFPRKTADSWGVKLSADGTQYVGPNLLGRLLMELRDNGGKLEYRLPEEMTRFVDLTQH